MIVKSTVMIMVVCFGDESVQCVRIFYLGSSKKSATASLLSPGDQEPRIRSTAVAPEPDLHLVARAEEDKSDDLEYEGGNHLVMGAGTGEVELQ